MHHRTLPPRGARRLMWALAALDVVAYGLFVKGAHAHSNLPTQPPILTQDSMRSVRR